ncbi:hypothetical protein D6C82_10587, partial [Aureobasidium pullulans]
TIHTIISAVHTTNLAISTYRNLCTSNAHKITAIKHLSLTADAVAIASLRKKYAQLITAEMKMCREVEGMKQGVVMLRLDLAELHELNGSVEERRNDDVEGEGWMPNIGLLRRREGMLITPLGTDSPTPPANSFSQQLSSYDEHRASYNRLEQAFGRDFEHNTSIGEDEELDIEMQWQYEQPEQKKSMNIDNIYAWIGKYF